MIHRVEVWSALWRAGAAVASVAAAAFFVSSAVEVSREASSPVKVSSLIVRNAEDVRAGGIIEVYEHLTATASCVTNVTRGFEYEEMQPLMPPVPGVQAIRYFPITNIPIPNASLLTEGDGGTGGTASRKPVDVDMLLAIPLPGKLWTGRAKFVEEYDAEPCGLLHSLIPVHPRLRKSSDWIVIKPEQK